MDLEKWVLDVDYRNSNKYSDHIISNEEFKELVANKLPYWHLTAEKADNGQIRLDSSYFWSYIIKTKLIDNPFVPQLPFKKQLQVLTDPTHTKLIGGSAGGSKSSILLMTAFMHIDNPDYACLALRESLNSLKRAGSLFHRALNWINKAQQIVPKSAMPKPNKTDMSITWPNGASVWFGATQSEGAVEDIMDRFSSTEFSTVLFDEAFELPNSYPYTFIRSRNRKVTNFEDLDKHVDLPLKLTLASNPPISTDTRRAWLKKEFIDPKYWNTNFTEQEWNYLEYNGNRFYPISYKDNPYMNNDEFLKNYEPIRKKDPSTYNRLVLGNWNVSSINTGLLYDRKTFEALSPYKIRKDYENIIISFDTSGNQGRDSSAMTVFGIIDNEISMLDTKAYDIFNLHDLTEIDSELIDLEIAEDMYNYGEMFGRIDTIIKEASTAGDQFRTDSYWTDLLEKTIDKFNCLYMSIPASKSKYDRAKPPAKFINENPELVRMNEHSHEYGRLIEELIRLHPSKKVMNKFPSPDNADSFNLGFQYFLDNIMYTGFTQVASLTPPRGAIPINSITAELQKNNPHAPHDVIGQQPIYHNSRI